MHIVSRSYRNQKVTTKSVLPSFPLFYKLNRLPQFKFKWIGKVLVFIVLILQLFTTTSAHSAPFAYITNLLSDDLSIIDTATQTEVTRIAIGNAPGPVAVHPDGQSVVVALEQDGLVIVDTVSHSITDFIPLPGAINGLTLSKDGNTAYVAHAGGQNQLTVVDLVALVVAETVTIFDVVQAVLSADGSELYASSYAGNFIARIDTSTYETLDTLTIAGSPVYSVVHPRLKRLYVSSHSVDGSGDAITVIDLESFSVINIIAVGNEPNVMVLHPDGSKLYVPCQRDAKSLWVIDTVTETVVATLEGPGEGSVSADVLKDGSAIYLSNWSDNSVSVIKSDTLSIVKTINVGSNPYPKGRFIGGPAASLGGVVDRMSVKKLTCHNISTGQTVQLIQEVGLYIWDCEAAGLVVNTGDKVSIRLKGEVQ
jgi:YVTN family beta-propeller protein